MNEAVTAQGAKAVTSQNETIPVDKAGNVLPPYLYGMDIIRFVAACSIAFTHFAWYGPNTGIIPDFFQLGQEFEYVQYALQVFFMISGFLIFYAGKGRTAIQYGIARVVRLWPSLLICASITYIIAFLDPQIPRSLEWWFNAVTMIPLMLGGMGPDWSYWTMTIELQCYALVFLLLMFVDIEKRLLSIIGIWLAASLALEVAGFHNTVPIISLGGFSGCFIIGAMLYAIWSGRKERLILLAMAPFAWSLASLQIYDQRVLVSASETVASYPWLPWVIIPVCTLLFAASVWGTDYLPKFLRGPTVRFLGAVAYPYYLVHQFLGYALIHATADIAWLSPIAVLAGAQVFTLGVASLIVAYWEPGLKPYVKGSLKWLVARASDLREAMRTARSRPKPQ